MAKDRYIEQTFPIKCRGRNEKGEEVLETPVEVKLRVYQGLGIDDGISSIVECKYNTGGHGQRCKASHPEVDKLGEGVTCPFGFDIPYALERKE